MHPDRIKPLPSVQTNVIEDDEGKESTNFQHKVHMYSSGPRIIPPEVLVPLPRVQNVQSLRVDKRGPSSNLISRGKKTFMPLYALKSQFQKNHEANAVTHQISGVAQEYSHLIKGQEIKIWKRSFANELGQLAQGIQGVKGTNTVIFILKYQVPKDKKVTYGKIVFKVKPEKEENDPTRLTVGGNLLDFTGNLSDPTVSVTTAKCVFKSVVSTPGAMFLLADIKHFYLNNILPDPEFMRIPLKIIPQEIIDAYKLTAPVDNHGCIYMCIKKGVYDLKQAGIIANQELVKHMAPFVYHPVQHTPGLWVHDSIKTIFSLVVGNFYVQYCSTENADIFF